MSGLTFQLQSGIHKRAVKIDSLKISLRDLRAEAFKFIQEACSFTDDTPQADWAIIAYGVKVYLSKPQASVAGSSLNENLSF
ncbi:hypothetical protein KIN20_033137 [Parelaphostrongylus tenuis]|uniref:Serine/threonine-protein kinase D1-3-like ubiquitin-like domain-containing protein n=1 Tax=Parelaphostrongylus tenuis TaxID=148309 RepID=A0AAD5WIJ5_PARTN|nr:hypothetical protein KIN20_033137 [Parelaphostrongylus tenuis]